MAADDEGSWVAITPLSFRCHSATGNHREITGGESPRVRTTVAAVKQVGIRTADGHAIAGRVKRAARGRGQEINDNANRYCSAPE